MGIILKNNKEIEIGILFDERKQLEANGEIKDIFDNKTKEKIKLDILKSNYTNLQLVEDYNTAYSLGLIYIELILDNKSNIKKVLNYTHNLSDFLAIFPISTVLLEPGMKQKLILQQTWLDWSKKYKKIIL